MRYLPTSPRKPLDQKRKSPEWMQFEEAESRKHGDKAIGEEEQEREEREEESHATHGRSAVRWMSPGYLDGHVPSPRRLFVRIQGISRLLATNAILQPESLHHETASSTS
ncbi:hypothetical protein CTAM01_12127 [Colletotrichum tamarilloi]|uniref:Uncharacterized protein n=1 Tax=Colletotrichum tamarilloi TaxID=1209934 RepID=A0ABQ9QVZ6_9PEZI|nr:uncharacterized protein CTAM01_12127 [Colletotrichum tamarilloi]KAK1486694.1 hypothetical protein CTAM01_12127 [Colletotrichum tamarilloi]